MLSGLLKIFLIDRLIDLQESFELEETIQNAFFHCIILSVGLKIPKL